MFTFTAVSIFSNVLAGPGILQFPAMVTAAGWLVTLAIILLFSVLTAKTCGMLSKALRQMAIREQQQGAEFLPRYELSDLVRQVFGHKSFLAFQLCLNVGMLLLCLASLSATGITVDRLFTLLTGNSYVLQLWGKHGYGWVKACRPGMDVLDCGTDLFSDTTLGITAGYVCVVCACLPLTFTNFASLMWFQYVALVVTAMAVLACVVTCFLPSPDPSAGWHALPAVGDSPGFAVSTCFLSFAIGFVVPSWWNENEPDCPAPRAINISLTYTTALYYIPMALLPAFAFAIPAGSSALDLFLNPEAVNPVCVCATYCLAILGIMPNVIAYSVAMRDNLQSLGPSFTFRTSLVIGCICPVLLAWALDNATGYGVQFQIVMNWAAIGILGVINFIVPQLIAIKLSGQQLMLAADAEDGMRAGLDDPFDAPKVDPWTVREHNQAKAMLAVSILLVVSGYALNMLGW